MAAVGADEKGPSFPTEPAQSRNQGGEEGEERETREKGRERERETPVALQSPLPQKACTDRRHRTLSEDTPHLADSSHLRKLVGCWDDTAHQSRFTRTLAGDPARNVRPSALIGPNDSGKP